jgi:hypothetical protein
MPFRLSRTLRMRAPRIGRKRSGQDFKIISQSPWNPQSS